TDEQGAHLRRNSLELSNYATIQIRDELSRLPGVGDITYLGQRDYSMRLWLDPQKMASYGLNAADVINAVQAQNVQVAAGQIGQPPTNSGQVSQYIITTLGRLENTDQFANIVLKNTGGTLVYLRDVANIELGAQSYDQSCTLDGKPSVALSIYQLPGSNALEVANRVKERMHQLKENFRPGIDYDIVYDTTPFIKESISEVFETLFDAIVLVAVVVLVFLQNWRSSLIPLIAVPVAVVGTFAVMAAMGFSLNNLTLFGLVLAIGIVVDDAIVVVEAVEHHIEEGMTPRAAAHQAMNEVSGPVIAVALVLSAVFVPCAFISGITGMFFRQFALTIAVSTVLSAFNSLTLSPALAAILLPSRGQRKDALGRLLDTLLGWFFRGFNKVFRRSTDGYIGAVSRLLRLGAVVMTVYGGLLVLTWWTSEHLPTGYIPNQDQGRFYLAIQLPDAASTERTQAVVDRVQQLVQPLPGIAHITGIAGMSFTYNANGSNFAQFFIAFDDFDKRQDPSMTAAGITGRVRKLLEKEIPGAMIGIFTPPPVSGLGSASGFKIIIEDRHSLGEKELEKAIKAVIERSETSDKVEGLKSIFRANVPQLYLDLNREQCQVRGVNPADVFATLQIYLGSFYVNDFNRFGRTWQVIAQANGEFRDDPDKVKLLKVRNKDGEMVPLGSLLDVRHVGGPINIGRYNMWPAAAILGATKPGVSTGQGIEEMERICKEVLPEGMAFEWTEINYMQIDAAKNIGNNLIFPLAVVFVFLVLAAQYESWALPLAVILVVPMCILGSLTGVTVTNGDINIFTQIGFVVLVGLA
ncbi:MAG TPA: efflux RND transporter permease subunit, partial [Gemmataceae bacterium]|nr:efflux RND transporter permease subunit [Gemmataceae bacterium]